MLHHLKCLLDYRGNGRSIQNELNGTGIPTVSLKIQIAKEAVEKQDRIKPQINHYILH